MSSDDSIIVMSAVGCPLLEIGFHHRPPLVSFKRVFHPSSWWKSFAVLVDRRSRFECSWVSTAIYSPCFMAVALPIKQVIHLGKSMVYVLECNTHFCFDTV